MTLVFFLTLSDCETGHPRELEFPPGISRWEPQAWHKGEEDLVSWKGVSHSVGDLPGHLAREVGTETVVGGATP